MPRTHIHAITGGLVANKTAANEDNLGTGPTEVIRFGLKVAYPKQALIGSRKRSKSCEPNRLKHLSRQLEGGLF